MLGYIKAYKPELRVKEYEMYKAVYCSLCKYMGKRYGFLTRFTLSYDFTFLALLNMSLSDAACAVKQGRCVCNPLKKCTYCAETDEFLRFPAAASVIMVYYNLLDNVADEKGIKKAACFLLSRIFGRAHRKAAADFPALEGAAAEYIKNQSEVEKSGCRDIDRAAEPTGRVLSKFFSHCSENDGDKRVLERLGYCMGRYIYLTDALCDREDDIKKKRYNPLSDGDGAERAQRNVYMCINEAVNAFELLNIKQLKNILGNIIYLGLEDTLKRSLANERPV